MKKRRRSAMTIMNSLLKMIDKLQYRIILAVFGGYLGNICAILVMTFGACCVAKLVEPRFSHLPLWAFALAAVLAGVLRGLLRFLEQYNNHDIAFRMLASLRYRIFGKLRDLAPAKLEGKQKGDVISMLTADVETLEVFYAHTISPIMIAILVEATVIVTVCIFGHPMMGGIALFSDIIIGVVFPFLFNTLMEKDGVDYRRTFAQSSSFFLDSVKGIADIVQYGRQDERKDSLDADSKMLNRKSVALKLKSSSAGALSNLLVSVTLIVMLMTGILLVRNGDLSLSHMIVCFVLVSSSFGPVLALSALPANLAQTLASGDRILDFMEEQPTVQEVTEGEKFTFDNLTLEHVDFGYDDLPVIDDINLTIHKGDILGLIGASGCGKSTVLKLMLRFYDPKDGRILYNGMDVRSINTANLHQNVVMVSQTTYLFDDTIWENLLVAKPDATEAEVKEACRKASIDTFIEQLPQGYQTEVGLLGDSLSAGEKQRIGLARAFLSGAPLILLDEVTSNVDAINEGIILKSIKDAAGAYTFVIVSHRESTVKICTDCYRMKSLHGR